MIVKNILKWISVLFITIALGIAQDVGEIVSVPDDTTKDPGLKPGDLAPSWALMYAPGKFEFLKNWTVERDQNLRSDSNFIEIYITKSCQILPRKLPSGQRSF